MVKQQMAVRVFPDLLFGQGKSSLHISIHSTISKLADEDIDFPFCQLFTEREEFIQICFDPIIPPEKV